MMRPGRSAFLFGCLVAALGLSPVLGCALAPLEPDGEIAEAGSELDSDSTDPDLPGDDLGDPGDLEPGPDPIPWKPEAKETVEEEPGVPQLGPDPIPWRPGDPDADSSDRSSSAP